MDDRQLNQRLSQIATVWSLVRQAHQGRDDDAAAARQEMMERYCGAVFRYLLAAVRDPHAAEDLTQEFALRFTRGLFRQADPGRGRFRDYVKTSLFHLVDDFRKRHAKEARQGPLPEHELAAPGAEALNTEQAFLSCWRQELLSRTWEALERQEKAAGQPLATVLRFRVDNPDVNAGAMAEQLGHQLGRSFTSAGIRQILHRAREKFSDFLLEEVARSLQTNDPERLQEELGELNLLKYCQTALQRRPPEPS